MQGDRKNTYDYEEDKKDENPVVEAKEKEEHQQFLEIEFPSLILVNRIATMELDRLESHHVINSYGRVESRLSQSLVPAEQSQKASSFNYHS
jgi:hypothetical protein